MTDCCLFLPLLSLRREFLTILLSPHCYFAVVAEIICSDITPINGCILVTCNPGHNSASDFVEVDVRPLQELQPTRTTRYLLGCMSWAN